ncbi:MAG: hypothetical protein ACYCOU_04650 [Sulfobacillus sp.]
MIRNVILFLLLACVAGLQVAAAQQAQSGNGANGTTVKPVESPSVAPSLFGASLIHITAENQVLRFSGIKEKVVGPILPFAGGHLQKTDAVTDAKLVMFEGEPAFVFGVANAYAAPKNKALGTLYVSHTRVVFKGNTLKSNNDVTVDVPRQVGAFVPREVYDHIVAAILHSGKEKYEVEFLAVDPKAGERTNSYYHDNNDQALLGFLNQLLNHFDETLAACIRAGMTDPGKQLSSVAQE